MDFSTTAVTEDVGVALDSLTSGYYATVDTTLCNCNVIDYETEKGYQVTYSSGTITIKEFNFSCKALHLLTPLYGAVQNGSDHTISRTVANYAIASASVSYDDTNKVIHLLTWSGTKLNDYAIDTADLNTCTATTHTIADVTFLNTGTNYATILRRDVILIDNGYAWAMVNSGQKIVKIDLTNDVVATGFEFTNPIYTINGSASTANNGSFMKLSNGDIYKFGNVTNDTLTAGGIEPCVYYHNGIMHYAKNYSISRYQSEVGNHSNNYGTFVRTAGSPSPSATYRVGVATCFPYVSTVCNLNNSVTKNAGLTMRLDYSVTES